VLLMAYESIRMLSLYLVGAWSNPIWHKAVMSEHTKYTNLFLKLQKDFEVKPEVIRQNIEVPIDMLDMINDILDIRKDLTPDLVEHIFVGDQPSPLPKSRRKLSRGLVADLDNSVLTYDIEAPTVVRWSEVEDNNKVEIVGDFDSVNWGVKITDMFNEGREVSYDYTQVPSNLGHDPYVASKSQFSQGFIQKPGKQMMVYRDEGASDYAAQMGAPAMQGNKKTLKRKEQKRKQRQKEVLQQGVLQPTYLNVAQQQRSKKPDESFRGRNLTFSMNHQGVARISEVGKPDRLREITGTQNVEEIHSYDKLTGLPKYTYASTSMTQSNNGIDPHLKKVNGELKIDYDKPYDLNYDYYPKHMYKAAEKYAGRPNQVEMIMKEREDLFNFYRYQSKKGGPVPLAWDEYQEKYGS